MPLRFINGLPILDPDGFPIDIEEPEIGEPWSDGEFFSDGFGWVD